MKSYASYAQLYLRMVLGIGFMYAVADRIGWLGPADGNTIGWGDWHTFLAYTHLLLSFVSKPLSDTMGCLATIAEVVIGLLLIVGYQTRLMAVGSFVLTLLFALAMAYSLGIKAPFNYSVFVVSAGSLLLAALPNYPYSIDSLLSGRSNKIFS